MRSFLALQALTPGFDPHHLLTFTVDLPDGLYGEKARAIFDRAIEAIEHLPGVQSAAVGGAFHSHIPNGVITVEDRAADDREPFTGWNVSPEYFKTIGLPLRRGRFFSSTETSGAVISDSMARRFWPGQDPLLKRFKRSLPGLDEGKWYMVLGVVGDRLVNGPGSSMLPTMYELDAGRSSTTMVVRTLMRSAAAGRSSPPGCPYHRSGNTIFRDHYSRPANVGNPGTTAVRNHPANDLRGARDSTRSGRHLWTFALSRRPEAQRDRHPPGAGRAQLRCCASCAQPRITRGGARIVSRHGGFLCRDARARKRSVRRHGHGSGSLSPALLFY